MFHYVPDWNLEEEFGHHGDIHPRASQKNSIGRETELVELLRQDGHVVMHSQNNSKTFAASSEFRTIQEHQPINLIQDEEAVSWYESPIDDSLAKDFCSEFFSEMAGISTISADKMTDNVVAKDDKCTAINSSNVAAAALQIQESRTIPLAKAQGSDAPNFVHFSRPLAGNLCEKGSGSRTTVAGQESSVTMANGSGICGSNQIPTQADFSTSDAAGLTRGSNEIARVCSPLQSEQKHAHELTFPSSSGGSAFSIRSMGAQDESNGCQKRKQRDVVGHEDQSEDLDESVDAKKPRRSRAAEVHNLSERRRRDRINERMKALQELIPHCNKTDKASMLDEVIDYLKSLQLQLQMMWMGSSMAQMMHPGMQQYMSGMGMGLAHASVPSMHQAVQLPSLPVVNQSAASSSGTNQAMFFPSPAANHRNLMQTVHCKDSHAPLFGFQHVHPHCQVMHQCAFGSHFLQQQNQQTAASRSSSFPSAAKVACEDNAQETDSDNLLCEVQIHHTALEVASTRNQFKDRNNFAGHYLINVLTIT